MLTRLYLGGHEAQLVSDPGVFGLARSQLHVVRVPLDYPTTTIYVDESGGVAKQRFFVVGALKVRRHGSFARSLRAVRDRTGFEHEFRFNQITRGSLPAYYDLVDTLAAGEVHFHACIVDRALFDPSANFSTTWDPHAQVIAQLLRGAIARRELVSVMMDSISTPKEVVFEDYVRSHVNMCFGCTSVVTALLLNSKACDGLQAVDVLAGALAWERRTTAEGHRHQNEKAKVVDRVKQRFNIDLTDARTPRTNLMTLRYLPREAGPERSTRRLKAAT
ncbi:MAG: DUF3800 domain-containing protein [Acidimicrobiales bacterium]